jgi:hypothetical protein
VIRVALPWAPFERPAFLRTDGKPIRGSQGHFLRPMECTAFRLAPEPPLIRPFERPAFELS